VSRLLTCDHAGDCDIVLHDRPRSLIYPGFFFLAAALSGAQAAQGYPGCAQPTQTGKIWYVDPLNGKSPAGGGNGSPGAPWNSVQGVLGGQWGASVPSVGYTRPMLSTVPYNHVTIAGRVDIADSVGRPPVHPGDTIVLMSGYYGDVNIGNYGLNTVNSDFVVIEAGVGQTPLFSTLYIRSTNRWVFKGIKVQSLSGTNNNKKPLVTVGDQGAQLPTTDIIFQNMELSSADSTTGWTKAQWVAQARLGLWAVGSPGDGANGQPYTSCISMTGSHIQNVRVGAALESNNSLFSLNQIDHFGDDGIDYAANNLAITHNNIHDNLDLGDGNHEDAMQGQNGPLGGRPLNSVLQTFSNILIDSNLVIRQTDPNLAFPTYLQGIDAFDEDWTNVAVMNNVIVTSACWGIGYASLHGSKIINNTVVADGLMPMPGNCRPLVSVGDKTHEGPSSNNVIIRNNIANGLSIYNTNPNMTMDHNICLTIEGKCRILTFVDGKPKWGVYKPGEYGDHNVIERRGAAGMFVSFDPAKFIYDLRLRPGALAIGAGSSIDAPSDDITGTHRGSSIDVGAYQYGPNK
jgi:hypothetical protein